MKIRNSIGAMLVAAALIVQIFAPAISNTFQVRMAVDVLADATICAHDAQAAMPDGGTVPAGHSHHAVCDFCCLASGSSLPPPDAAAARVAQTGEAVSCGTNRAAEAIAHSMALDHIRGRAPPTSS